MMEYPDMRPHKKFLRCNYFRRNAARNRCFFHSKKFEEYESQDTGYSYEGKSGYA